MVAKFVVIGVAVLLLLGVSYVVVVNFLVCPGYGKHLLNVMLMRHESESKVTFTMYLSSSGVSPNGATVDGHSYRTNDCVEVSTDDYALGSAEDARRDMEDTLKNAYQVYEHVTPAQVGNGNDREEVTLKLSSGGDYYILLRRSNKMRQIRSKSLFYAQAFERRYQLD